MTDEPSDTTHPEPGTGGRNVSPKVTNPARFLNRMITVPEPEMRIALWAELFRTQLPQHVLETVDALMSAVRSRHPSARVSILSFTRFLQRNRILAKQILLPIAVVEGHATILALLVDEPPFKTMEAAELERAAANEDKEITLGERRALARRPDPVLIERLLSDPDPVVVRNVLSNPRTVESQVVKLASRRPVPAAILIEVFQHQRWGLRPTIQSCLVQNPYTPLEIALGLLPLMPQSELRRLQREPSIHAILRGWAKDLIRRVET